MARKLDGWDFVPWAYCLTLAILGMVVLYVRALSAERQLSAWPCSEVCR